MLLSYSVAPYGTILAYLKYLRPLLAESRLSYTRMKGFVLLPPPMTNLLSSSSRTYNAGVLFMLPHQDSNLNKENQNLSCYHYTMGN